MTDREPDDFARCAGRTWSEDEFLAPECQTCRRWVAMYNDAHEERAFAVVAGVVAPTEQPCPLRAPIEE